jgi:translation initiation factor 2 subunit 2
MADSGASKSYLDLLKRAKQELPQPTSSGERWEIPKVDLMVEGRTTVLRNFDEILQKVRRESEHLTTFMLREIGTAGEAAGGRLTFQGNIAPKIVQERLNEYCRTYVICSECGRPDTHLSKDERTTVLKCEACGAHKPIQARRARTAPKPEPMVKEGKVVELIVQDVSQRGDGVGKMEGYTIFIPGGRKGAQLKVMIEKISGNVAFGRIQP